MDYLPLTSRQKGLFASIWLSLACQHSAFAAAPDYISPAFAADGFTLQFALDAAVENHPTIAAARAYAKAAGADVRAAKWQRFPSVSVEGILVDKRGNNVEAQAVVDQPIWTGGRIDGGIQRANARRSAAQAAHDEALLSIALSTAQAFFDVDRWRRRASILTRSLDQHNEMVATMQRRHTQEVSPLADLELARSRALQVEQQLYQARAQEAVAYARLRELVGDPLFTIGASPEAPASWPRFADDETVGQTLGFSPVLKRLRYQAQASDAEARIARAEILPKLSVQYTYSETLQHRVGLVLRFQSDGGLSNFAAADAAAYRATASELEIAAGERQLRDQLFGLLREYTAATLRLDGSIAAAGSAQAVMDSYMRQFTSGRRTWLDVMNAVRESAAAEIDVLDAYITAQSSLAFTLILSGQWTFVTSERVQ